MDTKTLVVGQDVYMRSGSYGQKGKVVKVTPAGVEVHDGVELFQFDIYGQGCDGHKTYECGPWEIDDEMPVAERTALWEQASEARKTGP
jgi:hypothetical protein